MRFPALPLDYATVAKVYKEAKLIHESLRSVRKISVCDLIKFCSRIDDISHNLTALEKIETGFREAKDCFGAMIPNYLDRSKITKTLSQSLGISDHRSDFYSVHYVPSLDIYDSQVKIGRVVIPVVSKRRGTLNACFANTDPALRLLEQICVAVKHNEPVLLVGETGTGKTTTVQQLASYLGQNLIVLNLSNQSDSTDLLGSFKPIDALMLVYPLKAEFDKLFKFTFETTNNAAFISMMDRLFIKKQFDKLIVGFKQAINKAQNLISKQKSNKNNQSTSKKRKFLDLSLEIEWENFEANLNKAQPQLLKIKSDFLFSFWEGTLVKAIKNGDWILLDEINLATGETLETLAGLLQGSEGSVLLLERGDTVPIKRHPNFRLFACMNPATDSGKRNLPSSLQSRFTEIWVESPDSTLNDLLMIIRSYMRDFLPPGAIGDLLLKNIATFYQEAKKLGNSGFLFDGADQKVNITMRTLTRALSCAYYACPVFESIQRALYEGCYMTFMTGLGKSSWDKLNNLMFTHVLAGVKNPLSFIKKPSKNPELLSLQMDLDKSSVVFTESRYTQVDCFWIEKGPLEISESLSEEFILTESVRINLANLARAVLSRKYPVLIQGPTSAGKTSMVEYLAKLTGTRFIRINNHEHTDLQEYIGGYMSNDQGLLVFQEVNNNPTNL
jgi:midasin